MITLDNPWWLLALAALPVLRSLHRRGAMELRTVPALFLWPNQSTGVDASAPKTSPDPIWRRRALLAGLLVLVVSGIGWQPQGASRPVRVEFTPGLSWQVTETDGRARAEHAATALRQALASAGDPAAVLLPLGGEAKPVDLSGLAASEIAAVLADSGGHERPRVLSTAFTQGDRTWLLSDGAGLSRADPADSGFQRVIQVGETTENLGIHRLSLRATAAGRWQGHVSVHNAGLSSATRALRVSRDGRTVADWALNVEPGASAIVGFELPNLDSPGSVLEAQLSPPDTLAADDVLALDPAPLQPLDVLLDGHCPETLEAAVAANPRLRLTSARARLELHCGDQPARARSGAVVVRFAAGDGAATRPVPTALLPPPLRGLVAVAPTRAVELTRDASDTLLLAGSPALPLVLVRPDDRRLDVSVALNDPAAGMPALLLDWLLDQLPEVLPEAFGSHPSGAAGPISVSVPTQRMRIAPAPLPSPSPASSAPAASSPATWPRTLLLGLALGLLLPELRGEAGLKPLT